MANPERPKIYKGKATQPEGLEESEGSETDNLPQEIRDLTRQAIERRFIFKKDKELLAKILGMSVSFLEFPRHASIRGAVLIGDDAHGYGAEYDRESPHVEKVTVTTTIVEEDKSERTRTEDVSVVTGLGVTLESVSPPQKPSIQISLIRPVTYKRGRETGVRVGYEGSSKNLACSLPEGLDRKKKYTVDDGLIICFTPEALGVLSQSGIKQNRPNFLYAIKASPPLRFRG